NTHESTPAALHGIMAEFASAEELLHAAQLTREAGYRDVDAYSPFPIHGMDEALALPRSPVPLIVLIGALAGTLLGFGLEYWISVIDYPILVGGKPFNSWPAFIPVAFETTILLGGLTAAISMIVINGLPMPYHPVFNVERFSLAMTDRFFLCIEARDPKFHPEETKRFLEALHS